MKVVIDTNIIISAALKDKDPEAVILFVVKHPDFEWIVSNEILQEYIEVLHRPKFHLPDEIIKRWEDIFAALTTVFEVNLSLAFPRDQKDAKFLECALSSNADYFITGDKDFTEAQKLVNTKIVSVSIFKKLVSDVLA